MPRNTFEPRTKKQGDRRIFRDQERFDHGMLSDPPASTLPEGAVTRLFNAIAFPRWLQGRYGSRLYSETAMPAMEGRTGYSGTKSGTTITSSDAGFTSADVGNYWVWDDGVEEEILTRVSSTQVTVRTSGTKEGEGCYLRGKLNAFMFHFGIKMLAVQLADEFFVADDLDITGWTKVYCWYQRSPSNAQSQWDEFGDDIVVFNSGHMFKLVLNGTYPYAYAMNGNIPPSRVAEVVRTNELAYGRKYIYTALRLDGEGMRTRVTGAKIIQETGPNAYDTTTLKDYGEIWTENLVGDSTKTHGELLGDTVANASLDAANLWAPVSDGTFTLSMNGDEYVVWVDFTGVRTMDEVAERVQAALRLHWLDATCTFESTDQFLITSGPVEDSTIDRVAAGVGGTDISGAGYLNIAAGTRSNNEVYAEPVTVEDLVTPKINAVSDIPEQYITHIGVYASMDIGVNGTDPVTGQGNNPELIIWEHDLRAAVAVYATRSSGGRVDASVGTFERQDVGSVLEWEDGTRETITSYVDTTTVYVEGGYYGEGDASNPQAAAIGDGRVFRASQSGNTVRRLAGASFTADDVGRTIYWSENTYSWITEYISSSRVRVYDSNTRQTQGMTIDPQGRNFRDTIDDDTLRARQVSLLIRNRTWTALPSGNVGQVVPGWLLTATRDENVFYYSALEQDYHYLAGYHNAGWQFNEDIKGAIQSIEEYPNRIAVFCANQVYGGPSNTSTQISLPKVGETISVLSGVQLLESALGVKDWGSIRRIDTGSQVMVCTDSSVRIFDGFRFGESLAVDPTTQMEAVMGDIRNWQRATASAYKDGELFLWGLEEDA